MAPWWPWDLKGGPSIRPAGKPPGVMSRTYVRFRVASSWLKTHMAQSCGRARRASFGDRRCDDHFTKHHGAQLLHHIAHTHTHLPNAQQLKKCEHCVCVCARAFVSTYEHCMYLLRLLNVGNTPPTQHPPKPLPIHTGTAPGFAMSATGPTYIWATT